MNYLSLFSGIGGFEYGIQQSKYKDILNNIGYSEIDYHADSIYRKKFPNHRRLGDVREINTGKLKDFQLLIAGFPCQSFSNSGNKQGLDDTRGTLFYQIGRILQDKKPLYFLLENVQGLLWNKHGETFQTILGILTDLGYIVSWEILDPRLFGIPQRRPRLFIKGTLGKSGRFQIPVIRRCAEKVNPSINNKHIKIKTDTSKRYKEAMVGDGVRISRLNQKNGGRGRVQPNSVGTLLCSCNWGVVTDDMQVRKLTPKEYERLQGFPDDWTKYGADGEIISDYQRYKCVGNAVNTKVITHIFNNWELIE